MNPTDYPQLARAIEVIGEAANKISAPTRADSKDIPWRRIVSLEADWTCGPDVTGIPEAETVRLDVH